MRIAWMVLLSSGMCVAGEPPRTGHPWEPAGYQGFVESIDALVGPEAVDCGFLNLLEDSTSQEARSRAHRCVRTALKGKQPFKFGTLRIPIDSYAYEVIARSSRGELWQVTFDLMLTDDESGQQWNRICRAASVDRKTLTIHGTDCVSQPDGRLTL